MFADVAVGTRPITEEMPSNFARTFDSDNSIVSQHRPKLGLFSIKRVIHITRTPLSRLL